MLIETVEVPAGATRHSESALAAPRIAVADRADGAEIAAHEARTARIENALLAIEALGRRRRANELVEAIERLGAGLSTTSDALDDALDAVAAQVPRPLLDDAPLPSVLDWMPISEPVAAIAPFVASPQPGSAPVHVAAVAPRPPVAAPLPAVVTPTTAIVAPASASLAARRTAVAPVAAPAPSPAEVEQQRRQAPAGLAAFVIDFSAPGR